MKPYIFAKNGLLASLLCAGLLVGCSSEPAQQQSSEPAPVTEAPKAEAPPPQNVEAQSAAVPEVAAEEDSGSKAAKKAKKTKKTTKKVKKTKKATARD